MQDTWRGNVQNLFLIMNAKNFDESLKQYLICLKSTQIKNYTLNVTTQNIITKLGLKKSSLH